MAAKKTFKGIEFDVPKGSWTIYPELCKGCGLCVEKCPTDVIVWSKDLGAYGTPRVEVKAEGCIACSRCEMVCPDGAISVIRERPNRENNIQQR